MCTRKISKIFINNLLFMSDLLKLKKINLKYQTGKENINVLKNIDLTIKKKETVSVVGESGSGKTSLIMLVGGLEKPTSGKIIFQNQEITRLNEDEVSEIRKKNIGIIFQSFYLIPNYTAVENVALTLELNNFKIQRMKQKVY
jgi:putative ABC transport system ATP-binding protein